MASRPLRYQPVTGGPSTLARLRLGEQVVPQESAHIVAQREQREDRRKHEPEVGLNHAVVAVAPERFEYPVVMRHIVQPELRPTPGGGNRLPPPPRTLEEQSPEVRVAADQLGELIGIDEVIDQAADPQGRVAEMPVPELGVPLRDRSPLGGPGEPARAGE